MGDSFTNELWERKQCVGIFEPHRKDRVLGMDAARTGMLGKLVNKLLSLMRKKDSVQRMEVRKMEGIS